MARNEHIKDKFASLFERAEQLKTDLQDAIDVAVMKITEGNSDRDIRLNTPLCFGDELIPIEYIGLDPFGDGIVLFSKDVGFMLRHHGAISLRDDEVGINFLLYLMTMLNADCYTINNN